jgi:hypothetical protein
VVLTRLDDGDPLATATFEPEPVEPKLPAELANELDPPEEPCEPPELDPPPPEECWATRVAERNKTETTNRLESRIEHLLTD